MYDLQLRLVNEGMTHILTYFPPEGITPKDIIELVESTGKKEGEEFDRLGIFIAKDILPSAN